MFVYECGGGDDDYDDYYDDDEVNFFGSQLIRLVCVDQSMNIRCTGDRMYKVKLKALEDLDHRRHQRYKFEHRLRSKRLYDFTTPHLLLLLIPPLDGFRQFLRCRRNLQKFISSLVH